ncbi:MAG TPA: BON domain-containing protein [Bryobacteraceae bacterium]|jgi:bifunctional DNA-binding transcriptional regulator/antitoxin component of YhaV-PrlF toxin-antitoxin module
MADLFRTKIVSKRQVTIPQRMIDLLGLKQGDEIHFKVMKGKIVGIQPVHVGEGDLEPDVAERFEQLENETPVSGLGDALAPYVMAAVPPQAAQPALPAASGRWFIPWGSPESGLLNSPALPPATFFQQLLERRRSGPMNVQRDDTRLQDAVAEALANSFLDFSQVAIHTQNGQVTLTGTMKDYREKLAAELFTSSVWGVTNVRNEIEIASSSEAEKASDRNEERLRS